MKLEVKNLSFSYPKHETIKDISFVANEGDVVAILGMNGVGKSTLLKCINKIHKPKSGEIFIDDKNVFEMKTSEIAKKIGYVAQVEQFADCTVFENVLLGRKPYIKWDLSKEDLDEVTDVLKQVNLDHLSDRHIDKLSGGERQKVAIARALAQKTPILMFDEPTSNLDIKNQVDVLDVIKEITTENKFISLISIHDINLALRYANKFLLLKNGTVYKYGDSSIINEETINEIYGVDSKIIERDNHKFIIIK